jgi:hypothetical protein
MKYEASSAIHSFRHPVKSYPAALVRVISRLDHALLTRQSRRLDGQPVGSPRTRSARPLQELPGILASPLLTAANLPRRVDRARLSGVESPAMLKASGRIQNDVYSRMQWRIMPRFGDETPGPSVRSANISLEPRDQDRS